MGHKLSGSAGSLLALVLVAAALVAGCAYTPGAPLSTPVPAGAGDGAQAGEATPATRRSDLVRVVAVLDGDTVMLPGDRKARLLGFNAPERDDPYDNEARDKLFELIGGQSVYVEYDVREIDQFGRDLVHLFLEDGTHVNLEMLRSGFSQAYTIPPNVAYADEFVAAEREARESGRGLWRPGDLPLRISDLEANPRGPDEENLNGEWVEVTNEGAVEVSLGGATLSDESNNVYRFPGVALAPGAAIRVHTGPGRDTARQLYWSRRQPVWNNAGDVAFLRDGEGGFLDLWRVE